MYIGMQDIHGKLKQDGDDMTVKELRQYRSICRELTEKNIELKSKTLHGAVKGSDSEFPYTQHTMTVSGLEDTYRNRVLLERIHTLKQRKQRIEEYIFAIDDSLTRQIFEERYIKGGYRPSWQRVATEIGGSNTADGVRMIHSRYVHSH